MEFKPYNPYEKIDTGKSINPSTPPVPGNFATPLTEEQIKKASLDFLVEKISIASKNLVVLIDSMNAKAPFHVFEYNSGPSTLVATRSTTNQIRVTAVVVQFPSNASNIQLTLGPITLPIDAPPSTGYVILSPISQVLQSLDTRSLSWSGGGNGTIWIMGEQIPITGTVQ